MPRNLSGLVPVRELKGDDDNDTRLLHEMCADARMYIQSHAWCPPVKELYFGCGLGGIVAVFLCEFASPVSEGDNQLWVVVGDLPSAYLVIDQAMTPVDALRAYCSLMDDWVNAVLTGTPLEDVFPIAVEATPASAHQLQSRVAFLRRRIIPQFVSVKPAADH